jgi:hypothetical protein
MATLTLAITLPTGEIEDTSVEVDDVQDATFYLISTMEAAIHFPAIGIDADYIASLAGQWEVKRAYLDEFEVVVSRFNGGLMDRYSFSL